MGTSTVLSAMEWRQLSRLPTTSSWDICMPARKLHKHQRVSSDMSHLIKRVVWARCGKSKSLSRYAPEICRLQRQQTLKKRSLWKSTKGNAIFQLDMSGKVLKIWRFLGFSANIHAWCIYIYIFPPNSWLKFGTTQRSVVQELFLQEKLGCFADTQPTNPAGMSGKRH